MNKYLKTISFLFVFAAILVAPRAARAQETVCTQSYGQPVVCGVKTPEEPIIVEAGLAENIRLIGFGLIGTSGILYGLAKRGKKNVPYIVNALEY